MDANELASLRAVNVLGGGELATVLRARGMKTDLAIIDERAARRLARFEGIAVIGCVGILERSHQRGLVCDLRPASRDLLAQGIWIDHLNQSLAFLRLSPL